VQAVVAAVTEYVYRRHEDLTTFNVIGWNKEDLERVQTSKGGYLVFTVEDVNIKETAIEDGDITYYVEATLCFAVESGDDIVGDPEIYQAYRSSDGRNDWIIEWYAS
jgi:hypothetical protein